MAFGFFFLNVIFIEHRYGCCRFPLLIFDAQSFAALRLLRESGPGSLGPAATLAHVVERRHFRLGPRLVGTGEEELQV